MWKRGGKKGDRLKHTFQVRNVKKVYWYHSDFINRLDTFRDVIKVRGGLLETKSVVFAKMAEKNFAASRFAAIFVQKIFAASRRKKKSYKNRRLRWRTILENMCKT